MQGVTFILFPQPHKDYKKCRIWVNACGRKNFRIKDVRQWTYMCSKHFVGGAGPTKKHPDPIPALSLEAQTQVSTNGKHIVQPQKRKI